MGNNISLGLSDNRPSSVLDCFNEYFELDEVKYLFMLDYQLDEQGELQSIIAFINNLSDVDEGSGEELKEPTPKSVNKPLVHRRDLVTGALIPMTPMEMPWFAEYCSDRDRECSSRFEKKFRRRFRMPYSEFWKLVDIIKNEGNGYFDRWMGCENDFSEEQTSPIELLLLGTLRYLGRGWTFDDIEEATAISLEVHRVFFHAFISWGSSCLYDRFVTTPSTKEEVDKHTAEFSTAGLDGAIGSSDATHILCFVNCGRMHAHRTFKLAGTARTYNLTVNHRRRILHTTSGHLATWNDIKIIGSYGFKVRVGRF